MPDVIHVERDTQGLQLALRSLFEEALIRHRMESAMEASSGYELARLEAELPERELSPGYFTRAGYLLDLSTAIEMGIPMDPATLTHADVMGIRAVRSARADYEREHPACPACGERQDNRHMKHCYACHIEFARGGN